MKEIITWFIYLFYIQIILIVQTSDLDMNAEENGLNHYNTNLGKSNLLELSSALLENQEIQFSYFGYNHYQNKDILDKFLQNSAINFQQYSSLEQTPHKSDTSTCPEEITFLPEDANNQPVNVLPYTTQQFTNMQNDAKDGNSYIEMQIPTSTNFETPNSDFTENEISKNNDGTENYRLCIEENEKSNFEQLPVLQLTSTDLPNDITFENECMESSDLNNFSLQINDKNYKRSINEKERQKKKIRKTKSDPVINALIETDIKNITCKRKALSSFTLIMIPYLDSIFSYIQKIDNIEIANVSEHLYAIEKMISNAKYKKLIFKKNIQSGIKKCLTNTYEQIAQMHNHRESHNNVKDAIDILDLSLITKSYVFLLFSYSNKFIVCNNIFIKKKLEEKKKLLEEYHKFPRRLLLGKGDINKLYDSFSFAILKALVFYPMMHIFKMLFHIHDDIFIPEGDRFKNPVLEEISFLKSTSEKFSKSCNIIKFTTGVRSKKLLNTLYRQNNEFIKDIRERMNLLSQKKLFLEKIIVSHLGNYKMFAYFFYYRMGALLLQRVFISHNKKTELLESVKIFKAFVELCEQNLRKFMGSEKITELNEQELNLIQKSDFIMHLIMIHCFYSIVYTYYSNIYQQYLQVVYIVSSHRENKRFYLKDELPEIRKVYILMREKLEYLNSFLSGFKTMRNVLIQHNEKYKITEQINEKAKLLAQALFDPNTPMNYSSNTNEQLGTLYQELSKLYDQLEELCNK